MHTYCNNSLVNCCYIHVLTTALLSRIHERAFTGTIVNGFQKNGIFPLHPNVFPDWKHKPEEKTRRPKPDKLECQKSWRRSQPAKSKNSRTVTLTANKGSGHKKTLWPEVKTVTEESSVDKQSISPGFCISNVKSGPTITVVDLLICNYVLDFCKCAVTLC